MIEGHNLVKTYFSGDVETHALRGVDIKIEKGEFVAIVGKSGAGKSTLLHQLSLLDVPTNGRIVLNDVITDDFSPSKRTQFRLDNLGYIFQDYALLPELTASDNVMVPLLMRNSKTSFAFEKAKEVLSKLGLQDRLHNLPSQLSGGEQQRVSIARAIAHEPLILFADEPTASLDSATSRVIIDYLKELNQGGQTIVMVTHELEYVKETHRVVELLDGKIVSDKKT